jgi:diguanylate cyclase (GGDEF)-like protein
MTRSLLVRSAFLYVALVVITICILVLFVFENQVDLIAENAALRGRLVGAELRGLLEDVVTARSEIGALSRIEEAQLEELGVPGLALYLEDGRLLGTIGESSPLRDAAGITLRGINRAITRRDFESRLFHHELHQDIRRIDLYVPFLRPDGASVVAVAEVSVSEVDDRLAYLYRQAALMGGLILVLHLLYAAYLYRSVVVPLGTLMAATREISQGNLNVRVPIVRRDEVGRLATAFNEMSVAVTAMREEARLANPLTGLPGNIAIAEEIDRRITQGLETAVLYVDIDNFKAYNDTYGFSRGDEAILFTRDCLFRSIGACAGCFVGHEGGDDFIIICDFEVWEHIAKELVRRFDEAREQFYGEADKRRGYIVALDRRGQEQRFPLISLSIAVVSNRHRSFAHHGEWVQSAAEVKRIAKREPYSSYAIDLRGSGDQRASNAAPEAEGADV